MGTKKSIVCQGIRYDSVLELARHFGVQPSKIGRRLRAGWSPEESVGLASRPKRSGHGTAVVFKGKRYPHLKALADELAIDSKTFRARLARGFTLEEAAVEKIQRRTSGASKAILFDGIAYESREKLAEAHHTRWSTALKRLARGWTMRQALGLDPEPPRFRNSEGHARETRWKNSRQSLDGLEPVPDAEGFKLYLIANSQNGKQYIGLTIGTLEARLKQHFASARRGRKAPLPNAIRKYGEAAFSISLLRSDAKSFRELQEQEINEIAARGTIGKGYNSAIGGAVGITKPITVEGRRFASRAQAAEHYGVDASVFNLRVTRLKWTPEEAAGVVSKGWKAKKIEVTVDGVGYKSIRQAALALGKNFRKVYDRFSAKGWTLEQALDIEPPPATVKVTGQSLTVFGVNYDSIGKAARAHGIDPETLRKRLAKGQLPDDAVNVARKHKKLPQK